MGSRHHDPLAVGGLDREHQPVGVRLDKLGNGDDQGADRGGGVVGQRAAQGDRDLAGIQRPRNRIDRGTLAEVDQPGRRQHVDAGVAHRVGGVARRHGYRITPGQAGFAHHTSRR